VLVLESRPPSLLADWPPGFERERKISVTSEIGKGTTFKVRLPMGSLTSPRTEAPRNAGDEPSVHVANLH
jgi:hypothetical protein